MNSKNLRRTKITKCKWMQLNWSMSSKLTPRECLIQMMRMTIFSKLISIRDRRSIGRISLLFSMVSKMTRNLKSWEVSKEWLKLILIMLLMIPSISPWETLSSKTLKLITPPWLSFWTTKNKRIWLISKHKFQFGEVLYVQKTLVSRTMLLTPLVSSHVSPVLLATKQKLTGSPLSMVMLNTELYLRFISPRKTVQGPTLIPEPK